jgi:hypothetical protein
MPQPALHVTMAWRVLEWWRRRPRRSPFPIHEATENAFCHGAVAPDMGLFPGGDPLVSQLAHTCATGRLARALLSRARSAIQRAFAWGWVSHMLADVEIHPLVNEQVARLPADSPAAGSPRLGHIMVEAGLDAWCLRHWRRARSTRLHHALDEKSARFVADALDDVYDLDLDPRHIAGLHRNVTRWYGAYLLLANRIANAHADAARGEVADARGNLGAFGDVIRRLANPHAAAIGFVHAVAPARSLVRQTVGAIRRHDSAIVGHVPSALDELEDWDLETGLIVGPVADDIVVQPSRLMMAEA